MAICIDPINPRLFGLEPALEGVFPPTVIPLSLKLCSPSFAQELECVKTIKETIMSLIVPIMSSFLKCAF